MRNECVCVCVPEHAHIRTHLLVSAKGKATLHMRIYIPTIVHFNQTPFVLIQIVVVATHTRIYIQEQRSPSLYVLTLILLLLLLLLSLDFVILNVDCDD